MIDGAGAQTFTGTATTTVGALPALTINKPAGTLTLAGTIRTALPWTYTAGTVDPGTSTVVFAGGTISGTHSLNNVEIRAATTVAAGTTLSLNGTLNLPLAVALTVNGTVIVYGDVSLTDGTIAGSGAVEARANVTQASTYDGGAGNLWFTGSGAQTFTGMATTTVGLLPAVNINKPLGTLTLGGDDSDGECLDLHGGHGRSGDVALGIRRWDDQRDAQPEQRRIPWGDHGGGWHDAEPERHAEHAFGGGADGEWDGDRQRGCHIDERVDRRERGG